MYLEQRRGRGSNDKEGQRQQGEGTLGRSADGGVQEVGVGWSEYGPESYYLQRWGLIESWILWYKVVHRQFLPPFISSFPLHQSFHSLCSTASFPFDSPSVSHYEACNVLVQWTAAPLDAVKLSCAQRLEFHHWILKNECILWSAVCGLQNETQKWGPGMLLVGRWRSPKKMRKTFTLS